MWYGLSVSLRRDTAHWFRYHLLLLLLLQFLCCRLWSCRQHVLPVHSNATSRCGACTYDGDPISTQPFSLEKRKFWKRGDLLPNRVSTRKPKEFDSSEILTDAIIVTCLSGSIRRWCHILIGLPSYACLYVSPCALHISFRICTRRCPHMAAPQLRSRIYLNADLLLMLDK